MEAAASDFKLQIQRRHWQQLQWRRHPLRLCVRGPSSVSAPERRRPGVARHPQRRIVRKSHGRRHSVASVPLRWLVSGKERPHTSVSQCVRLPPPCKALVDRRSGILLHLCFASLFRFLSCSIRNAQFIYFLTACTLFFLSRSSNALLCGFRGDNSKGQLLR